MGKIDPCDLEKLFSFSDFDLLEDDEVIINKIKNSKISHNFELVNEDYSGECNEFWDQFSLLLMTSNKLNRISFRSILNESV